MTALWKCMQIFPEMLLSFTETVNMERKLVSRYTQIDIKSVHPCVHHERGPGNTHAVWSTHPRSTPSQSAPMECPLSESSDCLLIKGALNAPQGSGSTVNIIISLADTLGRLFSSRSLVFTCSYAWSPPFVCLANQQGHSHGDGSYPPRRLRKGDPLITMPPS